MANNDEKFKQLKVEDALAYLEKVKTQFGDQPKIYNQFLDIMKNFKAHVIDTPGVIARVSELFRGHNNLILGFNTFLPPGFRITVPEEHLAEQREAAARKDREARQATAAQQQQQGGAQQPEFDTAINYVTKIKKRFSEETGTYKQFLEILHTYQKEQRNIKQVLDEVSHLFRDHPDLLKEFTYFLPDAVQEVAKSRLAAAAARSERRLQKQRRDAKRARSPGIVRGGGAQGRKRARSSTIPGEEEDDESVVVSINEQKFFERVKGALRYSTNKRHYNDFLNSIRLFQMQLLSAKELYTLTAGLLGPHSILQTELMKLVSVIPDTDFDDEDSEKLSVPLREVDFNNCKRITSSYRALPDRHNSGTCSGRSAEINEYLNDKLVSVPTGSEDWYTFKNVERSGCESAVFKTEDDHFEIDFIIESTRSAIHALEPLLKEVQELQAKKDGQFVIFKIDRRALSPVHMRCIGRIYGAHSKVIFELIDRNAIGAIPIIHNRLVQKVKEWVEQKQGKMEKIWKDILAKNYPQTLDYRYLHFPAQDKKNLSAKQMLSNIRAIAYPGVNFDPRSTDRVYLTPVEESPLPLVGQLESGAHESFVFEDIRVQKDALAVVKQTLKAHLKPDHFEKCLKLWRLYVLEFLGTAPSMMDTAKLPNAPAKTAAGTLDFSGPDLSLDDAYYADASFNYCLTNSARYSYLDDAGYMLYKLYSLLYSRLKKAKDLLSGREKGGKYRELLSIIHALLAKTVDMAAFETEVRRLLGNAGYFLFTFDKLVIQIAKIVNVFSLTSAERMVDAYSKYSVGVNNKETYKNLVRTFTSNNATIYRVDFIPGTLKDANSWGDAPTVDVTYLGSNRGSNTDEIIFHDD